MKRLVSPLITFCAVALAVSPCVAADVPAKSIAAVRTEHPPNLSAVLDASWKGAAVVSGFHQREPFETRPETEKTEVSIFYDKRTLYFGIHCFDKHPRAIAATELRRDTDYTVDDNFSVLISPNNDGQNGYVFTVNPLGTQFDSLLSNQGRVNDPNWDGIWQSNAKVTNDGWFATIAIPFSTLNFKTSDNVTMGLNFRRFIRRKNEEDLWQSYLRIFGLERVSEAGHLTDLRDIGSGRLMVIKPYALGGVRSNDTDGTHALHSAGFDFKYGLRSSLVANLTVNTDFADADVDPLRLNLSPFRVFLPEKRPFFLENSGVFEFGNGSTTQLFFSRQIGIDPITGLQVPLDIGAKIAGSIGKYDIGFLDARTRESGPIAATNYVVTRIKRRVLAESYVGAIVSDKQSGGNALDHYNRELGLDANFLLWKKLTLFGYYAKTFSYLPSQRGKDWTTSLDAKYSSNLVQGELQHGVVQPNFNPEVGFIDRTDLVTNFADLNISPRPKSGAVREYDFESFIQYQPDTHGVLQTQEWQATIRVNFHNGSYTDDDLADNFIQRLNAPFNIFKNVFIPAGLYHYDRHQFTYGSDLSKRFSYNFFERFGTYYNGTLNEFRIRQNYRPNSKIGFTGSETWDRFRLNGQLYNIYVASLNSSYSFNRFLTTSALVQANTVEDDPVSLNLRLRYTYRPDSDLFVIYNLGSQFNSIAAGNPVLTRERRLSIKFTYSFIR